MRRPVAKINKQWIREEIIKAGHASHFIADVPPTLGEVWSALDDVIQADRFALMDWDFRKKYVNYIRRTAP